ncbi:MAG: SDR family oxidoreductase [Bacteriovoracaceae bacterium]|jgi:3-oxoacyl-[acyl-carrier protein] reductase|nr:SDR family oxidoreductase [Bacteriovoracaceae bacterium]
MFENLHMDKVIIVTGGSRGLGCEIVKLLSSRGAHIAFTYGKNEKIANELLDEIADNTGREHICMQVEADSLEGYKKLSELVMEKWGKIDGLVNNLGVSEFYPLALLDEEDWDRTTRINLKSAFAATKSIIRPMIRKKSGSIVNVSSLAGVRILAAPIDYCATKAALKGFSESLCKEIGKYQIRVNCLAPGILDGGVAKGIPEEKKEEFFEQTALGRPGSFSEIAKVTSFLLSDLSGYMSGSTLIADGGL